MARDKTAATEVTPFDFGVSGQKFAKLERFLAFWSEYPTRDGLKAYLYRVSFPKLDQRQSGRAESSIAVFENPDHVPTVEELTQRWGSGRYNFMLNDLMRPSAVNQMARCTFEIDEPDAPPVYNPSDLIVAGEPGIKNKPFIERWQSEGWVIVEGQYNDVYLDKNKVKAPFASLLPPDKAAAFNRGNSEVLDKETLGKVVDRALSPVPAQPSQLETLLGPVLQEALKRSFNPPAAPVAAPSQFETLLVPVLQSALTRAVNPEAAPAAARSTTDDSITALIVRKFIEKNISNESAPAAAPAVVDSGSGWMALFTAAMPILPRVLDFLQAAVRANSGPPALPFVPAQPAYAGFPGGVPGGMAGAMPAGTMGEAPAMPAGVPAGAGGEGGDMFGKLGMMFAGNPQVQALLAVGEDALQAFQDGASGDDFACGVVFRKGGKAIYQTLSEMGKEGLLQALSMASGQIPGLADALTARRAELEKFLDEFFSYGQPPAAGEGDKG